MKIVHCKKKPFDVYIGRPSKWGNPFKIDSTTDRIAAVEKYRQWITAGNGKHLLNDLHELKGKVLGCWCAPLNCHGEVLLDLVNKHCKS